MAILAIAGFASAVQTASDDRSDTTTQVHFTDVAAASGLVFEHFLGSTGEFFFPEVTVGGTALFDFDGDGDLDAYLLPGCLLNPKKEISDARFPT